MKTIKYIDGIELIKGDQRLISEITGYKPGTIADQLHGRRKLNKKVKEACYMIMKDREKQIDSLKRK